MSISISGMSTTLALQLIDATKSQQLSLTQNDPANARAITNFKKEAASITSAKDFVNNYDVYNFVMDAFNLQAEAPGKALIQKTLESDPNKTGSLISATSNPNITALFNSVGFAVGGTGGNFADTNWQNTIVQKYVSQQFINDESSQNSAVGTALEFEQKASSIKSWYDVLDNANLTQFFQTALGLPSAMSGQPLDQQIKELSSKFDITTLSDPKVVSSLVQKFAVLSDAQNGTMSGTQSSILTLISSAVSAGSGKGQYIPATLDITSINFSALSASNLYG
ncbi:DUF1217 domain-containing protein [Solirhodobacter olei]|uniref:DUF1217 domain-containing protein n=1 Tax=Solirhodobacter olei TaxID=2493082 RepID=UPI000FDB3853|nr:DUF1217 domain-containing protein [Solirhodobacter olei]